MTPAKDVMGPEVQISERIAAGVRRAISLGEIAAGASMPSIRDMAQETGHSNNTVKAAYEILASDGFLVKPGGLTSRYRVTTDPFVRARGVMLRDESRTFVLTMVRQGFSQSEIVKAVREAAKV